MAMEGMSRDQQMFLQAMSMQMDLKFQPITVHMSGLSAQVGGAQTQLQGLQIQCSSTM